MFIDYTATRELVGSGADNIDCDAQRANRSIKKFGGESVSLDGTTRHSVLHRLENTWDIETVPITVADLPRWREFAASVANGETFTIDIFGTSASPDDPITVTMQENSFKENRFSKLYMTFSFIVIEA